MSLYIERDIRTFSQIDDLPKGLDGIYREFFERSFPGAKECYRDARSILEVIVAAYTPLSFDELAELTELDREESLRGALSTLAPFLKVLDSRYSLYHKSLADWLTTTEGPYRISKRRGHERFTKIGLPDSPDQNSAIWD